PTMDGQAALTISTDATDVAAAYDAVRQAAVKAHGREGECRSLGQLMVDIVIDLILHGSAVDAPEMSDPSYPMERLGDLRVPHRKAVEASVLVIVPAETATGASDRPAELAGMGTIDAEVARGIIQHARTWTRVVDDPVYDTVLAIDSKERFIPSGLKQLIHVRTPSCVGDDCGLPAHRADLDHITRVEHDGRTRHTNLQPLCRPSHQMKDEGGHWRVTPGEDGSTIWRSRWGAVRVVRPALRVRTQGAGLEADDCPF
ncbi:MAG: HNH endonuclease, partial [Amnibacterium sp.]